MIKQLAFLTHSLCKVLLYETTGCRLYASGRLELYAFISGTVMT